MKPIRIPLLLAVLLASPAPAQTTRYVWTNSPAPGAPFTDWTTAAHSIQEAIDAAVAGDTVLATDGVYSVGGRAAPGMALHNRVLITNAISVQSVNGESLTRIQGQGPVGPVAARCAYLTNGAILGGFRLEAGRTFDAAYPGEEDRSGGGAVLSADCLLFDCRVSGNEAAYCGGGVYAYPNASVESCAIVGNRAMEGGGVFLRSGTLLSCELNGNVADPGDGGGADVFDGDVADCAFVANNGHWGGGLFLDGGSASGILAVSNVASSGGGVFAAEAMLDGVRLFRNSAANSGGGAYLELCALANGVVSNNDLAWGSGGGGAADGAGLAVLGGQLDHCLVLDNRGFDADDCGGGISSRGPDLFPTMVSDCVIQGNSAGEGGGLYVFPSNVCILSTAGTNDFGIRENAATNAGGGICVATQAVLFAGGRLVVATNRAANGGGLAAFDGAQVDVEGDADFAPVFCGNVATNSGGGIFATGALTRITLQGVWIGRETEDPQGNVAWGNLSGSGGGGLALFAGAELLGTDLVVEGNRAPFRQGGGILLHHSQAALSSTAPPRPATAQPSTRFAFNRATNFNGGGIYSFASRLTIDNAFFLENAAVRGGGLHVDSGSTGRVANAVFAANLAGNGGGIRTFDGGTSNTVCALRHCSFYGNATGGVSAGGVVALSLANCIVYSNAGTQVSAGHDVAHSDVQGGYAGAGNVDADPSFRNPGAGDFHLSVDSTSSVVDAGTDAGLTNDCVFRARPLGSGFDMGAYEYRPDFDDSDGDGIPDGWEIARGLDPRADDAAGNPDVDAPDNLEEYLADTDPLDSNDFFRVTDCAYNPVRPDRGIFVGFNSSSNRLYSLYAVPVLSNWCTWAAMEGKTNYAGCGSYDGFNDTNAPFDAPARAYRVTVGPIPE